MTVPTIRLWVSYTPRLVGPIVIAHSKSFLSFNIPLGKRAALGVVLSCQMPDASCASSITSFSATFSAKDGKNHLRRSLLHAPKLLPAG